MINYTMFLLLDDLVFRSNYYRIIRLNDHLPYLKGLKYSYTFEEEPLIEIGIYKEDRQLLNIAINTDDNTVNMVILDSGATEEELILARPLLDTILVPQEVMPFVYQLQETRR